MGIWGSGSFQNDMAGDWKDEFTEVGSASFLLETFETLLNSFEESDNDEEYFAIAAAEIVVAIINKDYSFLPDDVKEYLKEHKIRIGDKLKKIALKTLELVDADMIAGEEWGAEDLKFFSTWKANIARLKSQLA